MKLKRIAIVLALFLATLPVATWWLLHTESGARWALAIARDMTGGALDYAALEGSIASGTVISSPSFSLDNLVVSATELRLAASFSLLPVRLQVSSAQVVELDIEMRSSGEGERQEASVDVGSILESLDLPIRLDFKGIEVDALTIRKSGQVRFRADSASVIAHWHDRITIHSFDLEGPGLNARVLGAMELEAPFELNADIEAVAEPGLPWLPQTTNSTLRLQGNLDSIKVELRERESGLEADGTLSALLRAPAWDLVLRLGEYRVLQQQQVVARNAVLSTSGSPGEFNLAADFLLDGLIRGNTATIKGSAQGSSAGLDIESLSVSQPGLALRAAGRLDFPATFRGALTIELLELDQWLGIPESPHTVTGSAHVDLSPSMLSITQGELALADAPSRVLIDASLDFSTGIVASELRWTELRWPLVTETPRIESRSGHAILSGAIDDWSVDLTADLSAPNLVQGRLGLAGQGTRERATFDITEGEVFGGVVDGDLAMDWSNGFGWSSNFEVRGLRTAALAPAYPGVLTVRAQAENAAGLSGVSIQILDLRGTLLDEAIAGGGHILVSRRSLEARALHISHGDNEFEADGELYGTSGLDFRLEIPDIGLYGPRLSGDISARGTIALGAPFTQTRIDAESTELDLAGYGFRGLALKSSRSAADGVSLEIEMDQLRLGPRTVDTIAMVAEIDRDSQRLAASLRPLGSDVRIALAGSFAGGADRPSFPWTGNLEEFSLATKEGEGGGLDAPVPVSLSPTGVSISGMCLSGDLRGRICADFAYDAADGINAAADATGVPVDVLNAFLQTGFDFEQEVSGELRWRQSAAGTTSGKANIQLSPGRLKSARFSDLDLYTGPGKLAVEIESGELLSGLLELPIGNSGIVDGWFRVEGSATDASSRIAGALRAETSDVDILAVMLPNVDEASGRLTADLEVTGTIGVPSLTGSAAIADGALNYFPLGLRLEELNVAGQFDEKRQLDIEGTFRAGQGEGAIRTSTSGSRDTEPGIHLSIRGSNLTLVDLPDITAVADTDLEIDYQGRRLDIMGSVDIPRARIRPVNLVTSRVDASEDVVIVAGSLPEVPEVEQNTDRLAVHGALSLGMGDDVQIRLDVARAAISGRADFEWSGDPVPIGRGRYNVNGTVSAFGQVLSISEGSVSFPGVPATNPLLNIRATRDIYGNTQVKRAGILVQGSVQQPTIEAYTYPLTTEERALTLLVTGNDFDYEQGVGAIDFGTYIAPRLFLSYGVGVFDRQNVISARYDLKAGFGIRATSAERESGVDLTYRFEN